MVHPEHGRLGRSPKKSLKRTARPPSDDPLLKREEWLRLAIQGSPMGLWYWNEETQSVYWDQKSCEIFDVSTKGQKALDTFYDRLHPDDVGRVREIWRYQLEHGLPCDVEYRVVRPDGSIRWIHARGSGFYDTDGKPLRMVGVHFDVTERKKAEQERSQLSGRLINAQEEERTRLARELHDDFGQKLALLSSDLEAVAKMIECPTAASERVLELRNVVHEIGRDLHSLSHRLHSSKLDLLGATRAIKSLCVECAATYGIQIDFHHEEMPNSMPSDTALCLFRIVQEGLQNVHKHSRASKVEVKLKGSHEAVTLILSDDGIGFEASNPPDGVGIRSMKERARMIGGICEILARPMQGTQIAVTLPLKVPALARDIGSV
jgi:PAS domain S-box-containing protein